MTHSTTPPTTIGPTTRCPACGRAGAAAAAEPRHTLCAGCRGRLRADLREVAALHRCGTDLLAPPHNWMSPQVMAPLADTVAERSSVATRAAIRRRLAALAIATGEPGHRVASCARLVAGLLADLDIIAEHPDAAWFVAEAAALAGHARRALWPAQPTAAAVANSA